MASNRFLLVDSRDRTSDSLSSTQFRIVLPEALHTIKKVRLLAVNIPNTVYNISAANNTFSFSRAGTTYQASLAPGTYTYFSLPPAVSAAMNAADTGNAYSVSYSNTTLKLTIAGNAAFALLWGSGAQNSPWYNLAGHCSCHIADWA